MKLKKSVGVLIFLVGLHAYGQSMTPEAREEVSYTQEAHLNSRYAHVGSLENAHLIAVGKNVGTVDAPYFVYGFVTAEGTMVTPLKYESIGNAFENRAAFERDGKWGFVDEKGKEIIRAQYDRVESFKNGRAAVVLNGKSGFIDPSGTVRVPIQYDHVFYFDKNKRCQVGKIVAVEGCRNINKYGLIDDEGRTIVPMVYDDIDIFHSWAEPAVAVVRIKEKAGLIDVNGRLLIPLAYEAIEVYAGLQTQQLVRVKEKGKRGLMNMQGKWVAPANYDFIGDFEEDRIVAEKDGKTFHLNTRGKLLSHAQE